MSAEPHVVLIHDKITVPPRAKRTITAFVDQSLEWSTTGTVTPVGKFTKATSSKSDNIPFDFNKNWQKHSSQSHQYNRVTLFNQEKHTNCRTLRSLAGAIQPHQAGGYGKSKSESGWWSGSDYLFDRTTKNEKPRTTEQYLLVSDIRKSWQNWGSYPNTDTKPQRTAWTERRRKTQPERWRRISKEIYRTICLDRDTADGNRKTGSGGHFGWTPWHIRET